MVKDFLFIWNKEGNQRLFPTIIQNINNEKYSIKISKSSNRFSIHCQISKIIENLLNIKVNGDFNICSGKSIKIIDVFNLIKHSWKKSFNKLKIKTDLILMKLLVRFRN